MNVDMSVLTCCRCKDKVLRMCGNMSVQCGLSKAKPSHATLSRGKPDVCASFARCGACHRAGRAIVQGVLHLCVVAPSCVVCSIVRGKASWGVCLVCVCGETTTMCQIGHPPNGYFNALIIVQAGMPAIHISCARAVWCQA